MSEHEQTQRVTIVTGATRGIGRAIALALAARGDIVVGTATREEGAQQISNVFKEAGFQGCGMVLDVRDRATLQPMVDAVMDRYQRIDILVNNAGITRDGLFIRMKLEDWQTVMQVNLEAAFSLSQACARPMMKARWGRIIQIGSVVGAMGNPGQCNYAAAKAGLEGLTRSLALELASRQITVNLVAPGFIQTDMTAALTEMQRQKIVARIPRRRLGEPEDIAHMVCFLVSEQADYITGQILHVNGGLYLN